MATQAINPNVQNLRQQFLADFNALLAKYDLEALQGDGIIHPHMDKQDQDGAKVKVVPPDYPNLYPETPTKAPQYAQITLVDTDPGVIRAGDLELQPYRTAISLNFWHVRAADAKVTTGTKAAKAAPVRETLTSEQLRKQAQGNALSHRADVVAMPAPKGE